MLFTTSRYASEATKRTARRLAPASAVYVARGKKTILGLVELARRSGERGVAVVEERAGKPFQIALIDVLAGGGWRWAGKKGLDDYGHAVKGKV